MTVDRYRDLQEGWKVMPPVPILLSMIAGYRYEEPRGIADFIADFPSGGISVPMG